MHTSRLFDSVHLSSNDSCLGLPVVQWLRLHAPNAEGLDWILGRGTRSHMQQLKIPHTATNPPPPPCSLINIYFFNDSCLQKWVYCVQWSFGVTILSNFVSTKQIHSSLPDYLYVCLFFGVSFEQIIMCYLNELNKISNMCLFFGCNLQYAES